MFEARRSIRRCEESVTPLSIAASAAWIVLPLSLIESSYLEAHPMLAPGLAFAFLAASLQGLCLYRAWSKAKRAIVLMRMCSGGADK
jgi:hypothetical protein